MNEATAMILIFNNICPFPKQRSPCQDGGEEGLPSSAGPMMELMRQLTRTEEELEKVKVSADGDFLDPVYNNYSSFEATSAF